MASWAQEPRPLPLDPSAHGSSGGRGADHNDPEESLDAAGRGQQTDQEQEDGLSQGPAHLLGGFKFTGPFLAPPRSPTRGPRRWRPSGFQATEISERESRCCPSGSHRSSERCCGSVARGLTGCEGLGRRQPVAARPQARVPTPSGAPGYRHRGGRREPPPAPARCIQCGPAGGAAPGSAEAPTAAAPVLGRRAPEPPASTVGDPWRDLDGEASRSLGARIGELLARKFREFLSQLGAEREEPRPPQTSSASQHQGGVAENRRGSAQCPDCSFLPDLPCQPSYFQELSLLTESLKKILLHQTPVLGPLRGGHSQFTTIRKAHERPHSTQAPKPKAVLTHSSSGEGSGPRRRCCPFRVRFADETLRDTALRYWERSCVVQQCLLKDQAASQSAAAEQVFGGVGRWLENLPRVLRPKAKKEKATASSLPTQELQGCLSENVSMASSLPFIPRATTQGQRGDLHTYPDAHDILEQVGKSPPSWSQKLESFLPKLLLQSVLKRSHSKGYQLLLPSATAQRAQR